MSRVNDVVSRQKASPAETRSRLQGSPSAAFQSANYRPLENYGVIGNLHTIALVGIDGSIDWCCIPHFDSPSVFGAILDYKKGGFYKIAPTTPTRPKQEYFPDTNILLTRFLSSDGVGEIVDFMPLSDHGQENVKDHRIYRTVRGVRGRVPFDLMCAPAFDYGRAAHRVVRHHHGVTFASPDLQLELYSPVPLTLSGNGGVHAAFTLSAGQSLTFVLREAPQGIPLADQNPIGTGDQAFEETMRFWRTWVARGHYAGRWRETVVRSALALKLLTFAPTGAIVAAPTTSLPELIGGRRNWDYRYTWIRDSSFTLYGLLRLGYSSEAEAFMGFLKDRLNETGPDGALQTMYGIHGERHLTEKTLPNWEGYAGSSPVRIGNAAHDQLQLDIYGELMDAVYLYNKHGSPISYELWTSLRRMLGYVCRHWRKKDQGIWEVRSGPQHFLYSKVMCWVALDRGLRLAQKRSFPSDWELWIKNRNAIYEDIMKHGWDAKRNTFVQHYGTSALDASSLILPLVKFISPTDPRMLSTLEAIKKKLVTDSLVHRYEIGRGVGDGLTGDEGTFSMCTFWYAEVLARSGQVDEARWVFEKMLGYANHLGLFGEEIGPSGEQLGNFPQAFTHLGLISAAFNIDRALDESSKK